MNDTKNMNKETSMADMQAKVKAMAEIINLNTFIEGEKNSLRQIRSYYRINEWAYKRFHSQDGFMHFRISQNGLYSDKDVFHQPDSISRFIRKGDRVVELGFGQGANLLYLAGRHPDAQFFGVDLAPLKKKHIPANVTSFQRDYSDLSVFEDNSVDVMYAIETIVHNSDKDRIYREVERILKPGGVMVIYDYALSAPYTSFDPVTQKAIALISKGCASPLIESLDELNSCYARCGLTVDERTDHSENTLPDLKRLETKAAKVLTRPWLAKLMFGLLPNQFVSNIIVGYLGHDSCASGTITYQEWVLRK